MGERVKKRRARLLAFIMGTVFGAACYWVPVEYQNLCEVLSRVIGAACGG